MITNFIHVKNTLHKIECLPKLANIKHNFFYQFYQTSNISTQLFQMESNNIILNYNWQHTFTIIILGTIYNILSSILKISYLIHSSQLSLQFTHNNNQLGHKTLILGLNINNI